MQDCQAQFQAGNLSVIALSFILKSAIFSLDCFQFGTLFGKARRLGCSICGCLCASGCRGRDLRGALLFGVRENVTDSSVCSLGDHRGLRRGKFKIHD